MDWTTDPPAAAGWYWFRASPGAREWLREVFPGRAAGGLCVTDDGATSRPVAGVGGEWAGPVSTPRTRAGRPGSRRVPPRPERKG